ncbi:cytochrome c oxidase assembly protein [Roseivivax sediminis]|uniref:Putative membrane protein n=1 Tax=Roseivivax sediminis TaxID=936889 RepID=A0A1I1V903_9RHOB|nr:cytochrome c oxidase assembly protein [Roseivivax sediminis]SFD79374.1 putative membrane protein [Roseivivax sediminis]
MRARFAAPALATLALVWVPDWEAALGAFPAHMLRHMTLVAVAAPLIVLAVPPLTRLAPPVALAAALEFSVVWAFHLPHLHAAAQTALPWFAVEQALFLAAGLAVWASALPPAPPLAGAGGLLLTSMHMTFLGALLVLAPSDLYAALCGRAPDLSGQQLGGILMLALGTPIYLIGGLALTARTLREGTT